ncbi:MAG: outer membrane protein assembly factor BamD [Verrucomicrobiota bacterium]
MKPSMRLVLLLGAIGMFWLALPQDCPAALVWRKGEGWNWEREGMAVANNPKDQLEIARNFQAQKKFDAAATAYRRVIIRWPTSFSCQEARLGLAESLTQLNYLYKAFKEYQNLIEKHPNSPHFDSAMQAQYDLANRFLKGEKHKIWRFRIFNGLEKAVEIYEQIVKNGPFSKFGPAAQFRIGLVYEKEKDNIAAVHAYEKLLERYPKDPLAEDAQFQIGWAYHSEAQRAEYDQNNANQSIASFKDFLVRYPASAKAEQARQLLAELKQEQSKGLFQIGHFYEKNKNYRAALIYFNEVIEQNPRSDWANQAQRKLALLAPLAKQQPAPK